MKGLYLVVLFAVVGLAWGDAVITLTQDNFDEIVDPAPIILVEFYAPWCGHCKHLEPEYEKAAQILAGEGIPLAKVDATEQRDLADRYEVKGYPTLFVFKSGALKDYDGPRDADGIVSYMRKKAGPLSKQLTSQDDIDKLRAREVSVIKYGSADDDWMAVANELENVAFGTVNEASLMGENEGKIVLFRSPDSREFVFDGDDLATWVKARSIPIAGEMTRSNMAEYVEAGVARLVAFIDVDWEKNVKRTKYYQRRLLKVGSEFEGQILFALADIVDFLAHDPSSYGVEGELGEYVIAIEQDGKKFVFGQYYDKFNVANLREFTQRFLDGEIAQYLKSEVAPEDNDGPVTVVVGTTFDEIVLDESKNVLIEFYAPWCGHCKSLAPKFDELGESFADDDKVVIAKIDATANDWNKDLFEVRGFPTIFFKPAGSDLDLQQYNGAREVKDFRKFIKSNGNF